MLGRRELRDFNKKQLCFVNHKKKKQFFMIQGLLFIIISVSHNFILDHFLDFNYKRSYSYTYSVKQVNICYNESIESGRSYNNCTISITNCFFTRMMEFIGHGGVIWVDSTKDNLEISMSMFNNCSCSGYGGAIYFISNSSDIKLVCANMCQAENKHFGNFQVTDRNQIEYISIAHCANNLNGYDPICLKGGNQTITNLNSSLNQVADVSGIRFVTAITLRSMFCTYSCNMASSSTCIYFQTLTGNISYSNIIQNNSPLLYGIIRLNGGSVMIENCILYMNQNSLYFCDVGALYIFNCIIHHSGTISNLANVITTNITHSITSTYSIMHFKTYYCHADDPIPLPTQIIPNPRTYDDYCDVILIKTVAFQENSMGMVLYPIYISLLSIFS